MKKRWICLYVENEIGVLAKITGLFSGKSYNLDSLTVGTTEDETISRMTIGLTSDDKTFEQIKKQLNRSIEIIKVIDYTGIPIYMKELLFISISDCTKEDKSELNKIAQKHKLNLIEYENNTALFECVKTEIENNEIISLLKQCFLNRIKVVRGGSVAVETNSFIS